jgi:hypothetical protein
MALDCPSSTQEGRAACRVSPGGSCVRAYARARNPVRPRSDPDGLFLALVRRRARTAPRSLAASVVPVSLVALGWLAWISASPRYWFPDAYAQKGDRGAPGPRGPRGSAGPPGPVGPDASSAIDDLDSRISDLEDSLDTLENEAGGSTIESDVQDATDKLDAVCTALSGYGGAFEEIYFSAC